MPKLAALGRPRPLWLLGPALVAGVAYLDPGNVAANMTAGARFGYLLLWVVVLGNLMAWLIQYLSAKLGIVTGKSLPEVLGERFGSRAGRIAYAEVIGGAVALWLLFDIPLVAGGAITGAISMALLWMQTRRGPRAFEIVITGLLVVIAVGFTAGVVAAPPGAEALGGLVPRFQGPDTVLLAASILGATVMPHAIYAHSSLTRDRFRDRERDGLAIPRLLRATRWDVSIALAIAGTVNVAILVLAAANLAGVDGTDSLEGAHAAIGAALGVGIATLFAVGLLASGLASTAVGAYAGSEIMHGLVRVRVPVTTRRLVTLVPALVILALGVDPTLALVLSQVVLSFGIPFALVPLVWLTSRRAVLGEHVNRWWTTALGALFALALVILNVLLLVLTVTGA
jgi:manganese transport protein